MICQINLNQEQAIEFRKLLARYDMSFFFKVRIDGLESIDIGIQSTQPIKYEILKSC